MNQFIRYLFLVCFLFNSSLMKAQIDLEKYDKEPFLIGTLNEYMGYQRTFTNGDDFYYQLISIMGKNDLKKALFIDSLFNLEYPDITFVDNGAPQGLKIYSPSLSQRIDNYYNYSPSRIFTIKMDTVYSGILKKEKFTTEKQIISFLLGAYLNNGIDKTGTASIIQFLKKENLLDKVKAYENVSYAFSFPNAPSKARLCAEFLKGLGCDGVEYIYRKSIPAGHFVIFEPSQKIMEVINDAELLSKYIETINTDHIEFKTYGTKFIWKEPYEPSFK
jgi:hypothetical protein